MKSSFTGSVATLQRTAAVIGIILPIIFTGLVVFESLLRPGYSQISDEISYLGVGPYSIIQNLNFVIAGVLFLIFTSGLVIAIPTPNGTRSRKLEICAALASLGIIFAGVTLILAGQANSSSLISTIDFYYLHTIASLLAFFALIAVQFLSWRAFASSDKKEWGNYRIYCLLSGLVSVALLIVFLLTFTSDYLGATERLFVAVPLIWIMITGIKLYSFSKRIAVAVPREN